MEETGLLFCFIRRPCLSLFRRGFLEKGGAHMTWRQWSEFEMLAVA
jgi:hypothetical protein